LLESWPRVVLGTELAAKFRQGRAVAADSADANVAVFGRNGAFLGTGQVSGGTLQPKRLLACASAGNGL
jgi:hypothetical protein